MLHYMKFSVLFCICLFLVFSCAKEEKAEPEVSAPGGDLELLLSYMVGSFSTQEQAQADSSYYDIRLEMVQIWNERTDGYWLYVEQAAAESLDKPYRQRVYHLTKEEDGSFCSEVLVFRNLHKYVGAWEHDDPLSDLNPDSLGIRTGCTVYLVKESSGLFIGGTIGKECRSTISGAHYAASEIKIGPDEIYTWDRGFDENDKQVWGARKGGYIFKRVNRL